MKNTVLGTQIIVSLLLIVVIVLQNRGQGLGSSFGGGGESYRSKRGFEKTLLYATIFLIFLFVATIILSLLL